MITPLIGHSTLQAQLAGMLAAGTLPHAVLLHGPQGIGKRVLAGKLAYRLLCGGKDLECDTASPVYHQLAAGSCPDFHTLEPEKDKKSIGIKQVRGLLGELVRSSEHQRVVLVDALEQLTDEAANALLKTLEEPRPNLTFVLVCHQLSATLPTIRSRCRLVRVSPLTEAETRAVLRAQGGDDDLAPMAHGCPGAVMGDAAKVLRETMVLLRPMLAGQSTKAPNVAQAPHVPQALLALLAEQRGNARYAKAYAGIHALQQRAAAINLPATLVADAAVALVRG